LDQPSNKTVTFYRYFVNVISRQPCKKLDAHFLIIPNQGQSVETKSAFVKSDTYCAIMKKQNGGFQFRKPPLF
jgi:hypothetical protein